MSIRATAVALGIAVVLAACSTSESASSATASLAATAPTTTASNTVSEPTVADPPGGTVAESVPSTVALEERSPPPCERTGTDVGGRVSAPELVEASGLVASRTHPGVLWAHNDGGGRPGVFALGSDGRDLGFHELPVEATDIEDIALAAGENGDRLYLADIGDNGEQRTSISVFRFSEPDPEAPGPVGSVERFEFTYPDRPHNAETLLVDERNDRIVVVTKEQAPRPDGEPDALGATELAFVFEGSLDASVPTELTPAGVVDTLQLERLASNSNLHPSTIFGFGGVVTGGDVSADGSMVALRTYEAVWVWPRSDEQSVAQVFEVADDLAGGPCEVVSILEDQGESVAFVGEELVTLGEGVEQPINLLGR